MGPLSKWSILKDLHAALRDSHEIDKVDLVQMLVDERHQRLLDHLEELKELVFSHVVL